MKIGHNSAPITEDDIHNVVQFLHQYPEMIENAEREAGIAESYAETVLAELTLRAEGKSHAERESRAMVQKEYREAKERAIVAASKESGVKAKYKANELISSLYQTLCANQRSTKI